MSSGRFCLLLWFGFFFGNEEEMNNSFGSFSKRKPLHWEGLGEGLISYNNFTVFQHLSGITTSEDVAPDVGTCFNQYLCPNGEAVPVRIQTLVTTAGAIYFAAIDLVELESRYIIIRRTYRSGNLNQDRRLLS